MDLAGQLLFHPGNQHPQDVSGNACLHFCVGHSEVVVLGGDDDGVNGFRHVTVGILDGYLAFGVGAQVLHGLALFADGGQFAEKQVADFQSQRHKVGRFVRGVAKHNALVTGALVFHVGLFNALVDVWGLLVDGAQDAARIGLKHVFALGVPNFADNVPGNFLGVEVGGRLDFAGQDHLAGGHQRFAGHFGRRVKRQEVVHQGIGNLVGNFVGVPFGHRFGGK